MKHYGNWTTILLTAALLIAAAGCSKKDEPVKKTAPAQAMVETNLVKIETTMGTIMIKLNPEKAPLSVKNFKAYVRAGFYNGTIVHRIENQGMYLIQAGGILPDLSQKEPILPPIPCESENGLKNKAGTIGYGRRQAPNTATSHFYINYKDNPGFDHRPGFVGYAVFGDVVEGNDVAAAIAGLNRLPDGRPEKQVLITSANIVMEPVSESGEQAQEEQR